MLGQQQLVRHLSTKEVVKWYSSSTGQRRAVFRSGGGGEKGGSGLGGEWDQ